MTVLAIILPLMIPVLLGFLVEKLPFIPPRWVALLSTITFQGLIPIFLFIHVATAQIPSSIHLEYFLSFYLPVLLIYFIGMFAYFHWHKSSAKKLSAASIFALGASYSNNVIVGIPLILQVIGQSALVYILAIVTFHSALLFAVTAYFTSSDAGFNRQQFLQNTLFNPLIMAILLGFIVNLSTITLPLPLTLFVKQLTAPALYFALFCLGYALSQYPLQQDKRFVCLASGLKLLGLPAVVYFFSHQVMQLTLIQTQILVLLSACPTGINAYLVALKAKQQHTLVASTVVLSTTLSTFTLPFWLWFLF